jgi:opacity protein-like surface antigen
MNGKSVLASFCAAAVLALAICAPAAAADLRKPLYTKAPPPAFTPLYNWTGFYVGANFGAGISRESFTAGIGNGFSTNPSGVVGGFQLGYNYQFAPNYLIGIEGELELTSDTGNNNFFAGAAGPVGGLSSNHNWYDTLDGRLGYVMGSSLLYIKGGAAWMNADYNMSAAGAAGIASQSINITRFGWNIGAGLEYMILPQWSAKIEYNFLDFGTDSTNFGGVPVFGPGTTVHTEVHEFKVGMNYHWLPGTLFGMW